MIGAVEATEIGDQTRLDIRVLGAEADRESARECTILLDDVPVGVVYVLCGNRARFRDIAHNVSIVVVARDEELPVDANRDETAHAARAMLRAGEVVAPEVFDRPCRAVRERDPLEDDVAAIVCEGVRLARLPLVVVETFDALHNAAVLVVVGVDHRKVALGRHNRASREHPILRIVGVDEAVVPDEVTVRVVDHLRGIHLGVLVEAVRRIVPRHSVERVGRAVADGVVGILILLHLPALEVPFSEFVK